MTSTLKTDKIEGVTASGTVAMPAGHVVQTAFHTFTTQTIITSTSDTDIASSSVTFTPKFASSLLMLTCSVSVLVYRANNYNGGSINFVVDSSNISHSSQTYEIYNVYPSGGTNFYHRFHKEVSTNASNTSAKTIKLVGKTYQTSDSGRIVINEATNFTSSIKIQEIAQ